MFGTSVSAILTGRLGSAAFVVVVTTGTLEVGVDAVGSTFSVDVVLAAVVDLVVSAAGMVVVVAVVTTGLVVVIVAPGGVFVVVVTVVVVLTLVVVVVADKGSKSKLVCIATSNTTIKNG